MGGQQRSHRVAHRPNPARRRTLYSAARTGDPAARGVVVGDHLGLVRSIAARYLGYGLEFDDLVQEGSIGLLDAIDRYDPSRGIPFDLYARFRIRGAIRNALTDQSRLIRLPKQIVERRRALDRVESQLLQAGLRPTPADLAAATGLSVAAVLEATQAAERPLSLDEALPSGSTLVGLVADHAESDPSARALEREQQALLDSAISRLKPRERRIVEAWWGIHGEEPTTSVELARELRISPRRTQTIGREALTHLRKDLQRPEPEPCALP